MVEYSLDRRNDDMKVKVFHTLHNYHLKDLPKDILTGIIIAAVSIPISMGYAEVSGIPAI